jgi:hypothetical protein
MNRLADIIIRAMGLLCFGIMVAFAILAARGL